MSKWDAQPQCGGGGGAAATAYPNWPLMMCVFSEVHLIKVAIIHNDDFPESYTYLDALLPGLYRNFDVPIAVQVLPIDYEEDEYDVGERYSIEGKYFQLRPKQKKVFRMSRYERNNGSRGDTLRNVIGSHFGVVVVSPKLAHLDEYLQGSARIPFRSQSGFFVIFVLEAVDKTNSNTNGEILRLLGSVVERLWRYYGILKAAIAFRCWGNEFFYFDPFRLKPNVSDDEDLTEYHNWGQTVLADFNNSPKYCGHTLLSLYKTFNGYPLYYRHFYHAPTSMKWDVFPGAFQQSRMCLFVRNYSKEFGGYDGLTFGNLMHKLQFNPVARNTNSTSTYGFRRRNNTLGGAYANVLYGETALAINPHFLMNTISGLDFLYPITFDFFCIITPKAPIIPRFLAFFRGWELSAYLTLFAIQFILYSCFVCARRLNPGRNESIGPAWNFLRSVLRTYVSCCEMHPTLNRYASERILLFTIMMLSLTMNGIFQGTLTTSYTTTTHFRDIETLQELDDSGMIIETSSPIVSVLLFGANNTNHVMSSLSKKVHLKSYDDEIMERLIEYRNISSLANRKDFKIINEYYVNSKGLAELHIIPECPRALYAGYIARKGWPLTERFNEIFQRFAAAGLDDLWYDASKTSLLLEINIHKIMEITWFSGETPCSLDDLKIAFYALAFGHLIALFVFGAEMLNYWLPRRFQ